MPSQYPMLAWHTSCCLATVSMSTQALGSNLSGQLSHKMVPVHMTAALQRALASRRRSAGRFSRLWNAAMRLWLLAVEALLRCAVSRACPLGA